MKQDPFAIPNVWKIVLSLLGIGMGLLVAIVIIYSFSRPNDIRVGAVNKNCIPRPKCLDDANCVVINNSDICPGKTPGKPVPLPTRIMPTINLQPTIIIPRETPVDFECPLRIVCLDGKTPVYNIPTRTCECPPLPILQVN